MAKRYGVGEGEACWLKGGFRRVKVRDGSSRGGVLGMAAVLTVSANGVETSPVTRGVFVSENILGVVPPPPPDEVPEIEPDVRGAKTLRERLAKHLASKTCAECHRKIDPPGFGLEMFDELGKWRDRYPKANKKAKALKVDATGEMPSGEKVDSFEGLKEGLVSTRAEVFQRHLISTLLAHATGRQMEAVDQFAMRDIQAKVESGGGGLRTLVVEALVSEIFQSR